MIPGPAIRGARLGWLLAALAGGACATLPHPGTLAGVWVDLKHTDPADSSIWVFRSNGGDFLLRVRSGRPGGGHGRTTRYGSWYVKGSLADTAHRELCVVRRAGRDGGSCSRFRLDTLRVDGSRRRRLVLLDYQGARHRSDRVLQERP